jgi:PAS domain S-box-containing protein
MATQDRGAFSRTIRIDLISDLESKAAKGGKAFITQPTARHRRVGPSDAQDVEHGAFFNELLEGVYDATLITDLQGQIKDCNIRAVEFLLYDRAELARMTLFEIISGADAPLLDSISHRLETERFTVIEAYCVRKDGTFFPSEIAVNRMVLDEPSLRFFIRDTTARHQLEQMLLTEHNAIQNADSGIAVVDTTGRVEYVNPAAARIWGYESPEAVTSVDVRRLFGDRAVSDAILSAVLGEGRTWTGEVDACRTDGSALSVHVSAVCNHNADGEIVGFVLSITDISDRKRAEVAVREAERQRVMLESIGSACHHMSQPVTMILTNVELMQKLGFSGANMPELARISVDAAKSLGGILHRLNAVNQYQTTEYLGEKQNGGDGAATSRILKL